MKFLALAFSLLSIQTSANDQLIRQLMTSVSSEELEADFKFIKTRAGMRSVNVSFDDCQKANELRRETPINLPAILYYGDLCSQKIFESDEYGIVGFEFENKTKNAINPRTVNSTRSFNFSFEQRHTHNAHISITENSGLTGSMSHDLLETSIVLIPRKIVPSMEVYHFNGTQYRRVHLATSETIDINAYSGEIVSGVFKESPMDMTASRHDRKFAGLEYLGRGIMIRVDRRAGTPEHIYTQSFNRNERIREATLTHQGKTCYIPKELIWENAHDADKSTYFKYKSDQEFLDRVVNPRCHWNLSLNDLE
jgi:hypothetical protein